MRPAGLGQGGARGDRGHVATVGVAIGGPVRRQLGGVAPRPGGMHGGGLGEGHEEERYRRRNPSMSRSSPIPNASLRGAAAAARLNQGSTEHVVDQHADRVDGLSPGEARGLEQPSRRSRIAVIHGPSGEWVSSSSAIRGRATSASWISTSTSRRLSCHGPWGWAVRDVERPADHRVEQGLLGVQVAVERHVADPELGRDAAEADRLQAVGVEQAQGGVGDLLGGHLLGATSRPRRRTAR